MSEIMRVVDIDRNTRQVDLVVDKEEIFVPDGIGDIRDWKVDQDFVEITDDGKFVFKADDGYYRIIAYENLKYLKFEPLGKDDKPAILQPDDGTGTIWIIGDGVGKPRVSNQSGWRNENLDKALAMAPLGNGRFQITLTAGQTINTEGVNFKFFHQKGWGGEFTADKLESTNPLFFVGDGKKTDHRGDIRHDGNIGLTQSLQNNATYRFTIELQGQGRAILDAVLQTGL